MGQIDLISTYSTLEIRLTNDPKRSIPDLLQDPTPTPSTHLWMIMQYSKKNLLKPAGISVNFDKDDLGIQVKFGMDMDGTRILENFSFKKYYE